MPDFAQAFITRSRALLTAEYLPKIERCLEKLTDEQVWWRANPESNSIGNLMLHLSGNARQWVVCGLGGAPDVRDRPQEFSERRVMSRAELLSNLRRTVREVEKALAQFDPAGILERRTIQGGEVTALEAILHVVEHFSMHTGQIILLTKLLTATDLHFYHFEGDKPLRHFSSRSS
jgi:uncharacterized damage-inducible protein DinB